MVSIRTLALAFTWLLFGLTCTALAQHADSPIVDRSPDSIRESAQRNGLHVNPVAAYALVGAVVHRSPTADPQVETVLVANGRVVAIGQDIPIPAGTRRDCKALVRGFYRCVHRD